jgi:nucleoside-diphosphate-sugar epimerase
VFHCAACSSDWAPRRVFEEANVTGVSNLLAAARRAGGIARFVHVSTTDVYGYPHEPCAESHPAVDAGLPYNSTKCAGEALVWAAAREGLPVTVIRPATIYGPRSKDFAVEIAKHIRAGSMLVIDHGRAPGGFAYVDNVAGAMIAAAEAGATAGRAYNIADGTGATWRMYVDALADGLGRRRPWLDLPSAIALPLARTMEAVHGALHLPGRPLLTRHAVLLLSRNQEYPADAARRDFGFAPAISLKEGIARTVEWLNKQRV